MPSKPVYAALTLIAATTLACGLLSGSPGPSAVPSGTAAAPTQPAAASAAPASETPAPQASATSTPGAPADAILVDSFDQEVYPFQQDGDCSLGEAIWTALLHKQQDGCVLPAGSTTIFLPVGTYTLSEADDSPVAMPGNANNDRLGLAPAGFPVIFDKVNILGNGATIQRTGANKFSIFQVFVRGDLTLSDLTITGGDATAGQYSDSDGGAMQLTGGQVSLQHVTLSGNRAENGGAMVIQGARVTITDSVIEGNVSTGEGGAIYNIGTLTLKDSRVTGNIAQSSVFGGGGIYNEGGKLTLDHSRVEGNTAQEGGGIYNDGGSLNILNGSTLAANLAAETDADIPHGGGAINNIGDGAQVTISDSFILGNHAEKTTGGGIYNQAALTVKNSVLAYNLGGAGGALYNDGEGSGSISGSCIFQNKALAVTPAGLGGGIESGSETPFDASQNWWGAKDGPGPFGPGNGDSVTRNVTFDNFLRSTADICAAAIPTPALTPPAP